MTIGERLRSWRKSLSLTTLDISNSTGISKGGLSEYENDKKLIGSKTLISLYREYGIDINWILTGDKKNTLNLTKNELEALENFRYLPEREQIKFIGRLEDAAAPYKSKELSSSHSETG